MKYAIALMLLLCGTVPAAAQQTEQEAGAQVFQQLKSEHVLVASSPLYDVLRPISLAIVRVAQPQYQYPIHFYIVHSKNPNAFAVAGGNIYVVDSLFYFVHNTEELAGTLCHETSHLIHHDSVLQSEHEQTIRRRQVVATVIFGTRFSTVLAASAIGKLDSLHYSRGIEERADLTGADTCAAAGYNPWGLVWLFNDFANAGGQTLPEVFSDHPNDPDRISALQRYFAENPSRFSRYRSDPGTAKPLRVPKHAAEKFAS